MDEPKKKIDDVQESLSKKEVKSVAKPLPIPKKDSESKEKVDFGKYLESVRKNPWVASTLVLAIVVIVMLVLSGGGVTGNTVGAETVSQNLLDFIDSKGQGTVDIISVEKGDSFYEVVVNYEGNDIPLQVSLDGKYLLSGVVPLVGAPVDPSVGQQQPPADIPKSDRPVVEAFVMSHCPFGTQIEKGLIPVVELLGDKIDFELKFVNYAMHGETEITEQTKQYCIQKEQNAKFIDYLKCFLEDGDSDRCFTKVGIDKAKVDSCVEVADTEFSITENLEDESSWSGGRYPQFNIHADENTKYGVRGSPALVINGQTASSGRDSASLLAAICNAFDEAPEECNTELSSASPSSGFGYEASVGSGSEGSCD